MPSPTGFGFQGLYLQARSYKSCFTNPEVKTDLCLRLLYSLGYITKIAFKTVPFATRARFQAVTCVAGKRRGNQRRTERQYIS
jgi:hypothetical protein